MSTHKRVNQMAHLWQKQISENSCKAIIVDTILESVQPLTQIELSKEITEIFHVLIAKDRLDQIITALCEESVIFFDEENHIHISSAMKATYLKERLQENALRNDAINLWLSSLKKDNTISQSLENDLSQALPIFLRSLFVRHGVSSFELITGRQFAVNFDIQQIAEDVSSQFSAENQSEINSFLPTIFQTLDETKIVEYLTRSIEKAIGYISEVISEESLAQISKSLSELTLYLDTNVIYRLLNLQGQSRYDSIRETLNFCLKHGVKLRVSAQTKKELTARLKFDSKVLLQHPTQTNLAHVGYNYRSADNYVSTYWRQARKTHISVEDYIAYYQNFDILLEADGIVIENVEIGEEAFLEHVKETYEQLSLRDVNYEKSDHGLWHDAYNMAYVQKLQKIDAKTAVDTGCLFLTTDQALTAFQQEAHMLKDSGPIAIVPSQLLQLFGFSTPDAGYEETFIKFFAASSLGRSFKYNNSDIQEIVSRISHYQGVSPEIAERVLSRELINSRYFAAKSDEEKEEIIYNSISEELLHELKLTKEQVASLESERFQLSEDHQAAIELLAKNEAQFTAEKIKLQVSSTEVEKKLGEETKARLAAEAETANIKSYSSIQERFYIDEKWNKWRRQHLALFWLSLIGSCVVIALSIYLWLRMDDSGCLGLLGALAVTVPLVAVGAKAFSPGTEEEIRQKYLDTYRNKLEKT